MPTVLRAGPYRLYFYSNDDGEPAHIHMERDDARAKFWLDPVMWQRSRGFGDKELREIERLIRQHRTQLMEAWDEYFGG